MRPALKLAMKIGILLTVSIVGVCLACLAIAAENKPQTGLSTDNTAAIVAYLAESDSEYRQLLKDCLSGPQTGWQSRFTLPKQPGEPELLAMLICSSLMDTQEKQYWFDTLPSMTQQQKEQLRVNLIPEFISSTDPIQQALEVLNRNMLDSGVMQ